MKTLVSETFEIMLEIIHKHEKGLVFCSYLVSSDVWNTRTCFPIFFKCIFNCQKQNSSITCLE